MEIKSRSILLYLVIPILRFLEISLVIIIIFYSDFNTVKTTISVMELSLSSIVLLIVVLFFEYNWNFICCENYKIKNDCRYILESKYNKKDIKRKICCGKDNTNDKVFINNPEIRKSFLLSQSLISMLIFFFLDLVFNLKRNDYNTIIPLSKSGLPILWSKY